MRITFVDEKNNMKTANFRPEINIKTNSIR